MRLEHINKVFAAKVIFQDFNYEFKEGVYFIKGASAKGKTTLFRMIAGLETYTGVISGNEDVVLLFQEDRLLEDFSVYNNLKLVKQDLSQQEAKELLKEIGLDVKLKDPVKELSGGMKRRLAIVRCLLVEGQIYLFDEALKGLDEKNIEAVMRYIHKRCKGQMILWASHHLEERRYFEDCTMLDLDLLNTIKV